MAPVLLTPNGTDTDGDGLADGQELFVKSVKTPKRYPTRDQLWVSSDKVDLALGVTLTKGTNPLTWDGDGVRDSSDLDPLHNLLVAVKMKKVHHGAGPWCTPELVGIAQANDIHAELGHVASW